MANEGLLLAAVGGLALFALFRRPGGAGAPTASPNGGQLASLYGGSSIDDFAANATLRADEASGVGKGYLIDASPGMASIEGGALGPGGLGPARAPETTNLTTVPTLKIGSAGDYVKVPEDLPPGSTSQDEDIGMRPWTASGLQFGGSNSDAAPTSITLPSSAVPVMNQTIFEVDIASTGHISDVVNPTPEQPGMIANIKSPVIDTGSGALDDFQPVDTLPSLVQVGTSDNAWIDAHVEDSISRLAGIRRAQGAPPMSLEYINRMASEIRAANIDLPVMRSANR